MIFGGFSEGDHVVLREDLYGCLGALGYPIARRGTRAIVRRPPTWFSGRYEVEIASGRRLLVSGRKLRPAPYGHGDEAWRRWKANRQGVRLGMFIVLGLPAAVAVVRYYAEGGTTSGLVTALPGAVLAVVMDLIGVISLPVAALVGVLLWALHRRRG